jgi:hypothetical protein
MIAPMQHEENKRCTSFVVALAIAIGFPLQYLVILYLSLNCYVVQHLALLPNCHNDPKAFCKV